MYESLSLSLSQTSLCTKQVYCTFIFPSERHPAGVKDLHKQNRAETASDTWLQSVKMISQGTVCFHLAELNLCWPGGLLTHSCKGPLHSAVPANTNCFYCRSCTASSLLAAGTYILTVIQWWDCWVYRGVCYCTPESWCGFYFRDEINIRWLKLKNERDKIFCLLSARMSNNHKHHATRTSEVNKS